jgi:hypothetical protein
VACELQPADRAAARLNNTEMADSWSHLYSHLRPSARDTLRRRETDNSRADLRSVEDQEPFDLFPS